MRQLRGFIKNRQGGAYLHVYNHITSEMPDYYPLNDEMRHTAFFRLTKLYQIKYNIEIIAFVCMGNHYHCLAYCPEEKFTAQEAADAYNLFHANDQHPPQVRSDDSEALFVQKNCNNISEYMRELQRGFTLWYNENCGYKRSGHLWQDRFKAQLIESAAYLWTCLKYVEMNPVRAKISTNAEHYSGSSYGQWSQSGRHPYPNAFLKHIVSLSRSGEKITMEEFYPYMKQELAAMQEADKMRKFMRDGEIEAAKEVQKQIAEKCEEKGAGINIQIFELTYKDFHSKKFIGSKEFVTKEYHDWLRYKHEFDQKLIVQET